jgi:hypothetical protein
MAAKILKLFLPLAPCPQQSCGLNDKSLTEHHIIGD